MNILSLKINAFKLKSLRVDIKIWQTCLLNLKFLILNDGKNISMIYKYISKVYIFVSIVYK